MTNKVFQSLLPSNSTPLERAIEQTSAERIEGMNFDFRSLYSPDKCSMEYLPYLAWAYRVPVWETYWSEGRQRDAIRQSIQINRKAGTGWAVKAALRLAKIEANLIEWWQKTPEGTPYTFTVDISLNDQSAGIFGKLRTYTRLRHIVGEYKPVRAHYDINMSANLTSGLALATPVEVDASVDSVAETLPVQPRPVETGLALATPSEIDAAVDAVAEAQPVQPRSMGIQFGLSVPAEVDASVDSVAETLPVQPRPLATALGLAALSEIDAAVDAVAESQPVQPRPVALGLPVSGLVIELCATINLGYSA